MQIDPNVQVAIVGVFSTIVTTGGVIAVAMANNRKERDKAASAGVESALDERDILERMLSLIDENERKESAITASKARIAILEHENRELRAENDLLKGKPPDDGTPPT